MRTISLFVLVTSCLGGIACGASGPPPEEEVTATWTAGDDEPLEDEGGEESGERDAD